LDLDAAITSTGSDVTDVQAEVDAIEATIGCLVDANGDYVAFTGTNYLNSNSSLCEDLTDLDAAVKANETAVTNAQSEIDAVEAGVGGIGTDGVYVVKSGTNYLDGNASLNGDILDLDAAIASTGSDVTDVQAEVDAIETSLGCLVDTDGVYQAFSGTNYIDGNSSLCEDLTDLDAAVKSNKDEIGDTSSYSSHNVVVDNDSLSVAIGKLDAELANSVGTSSVDSVTTITTIDSVEMADVIGAKWFVTAYSVSTPANRMTVELMAAHDGSTVDYNQYAKLKMGAKITGLKIEVNKVGTTMALQVTATGAVNVRATRVKVDA
jgi:hypothetical protein